MHRRFISFALVVLASAPFAVLAGRQDPQDQPSEKVFKNIVSFKGVPSSDLIPAMEFMCASLKWKCEDCHKPDDFAADTPEKTTTRKMIDLQREINKKFFNNKLEVTCMTCHNGEDEPVSVPLPSGLTLTHPRMDKAPKAAEVFAKHVAAVGSDPAMVVLNGTMTAPNIATHEIQTNPIEFAQAGGGKYFISSAEKVIICDGATSSFGGNELWGEPAAIFARIGRSWRGAKAFDGLEGSGVVGEERVGDIDTIVVRTSRQSTTSMEELYFDAKSGLLVRMVNIRRSSLGNVVSVFDYENYKSTSGSMFPMRVVATFPGGEEQWIMNFDKASLSSAVDESKFKIGG